MLCGTADVHPDFDGCLARSRLRVDVGGSDSVANRGGGRGGVGAAGATEKSRLVNQLFGWFVRWLSIVGFLRLPVKLEMWMPLFL